MYYTTLVKEVYIMYEISGKPDLMSRLFISGGKNRILVSCSEEEKDFLLFSSSLQGKTLFFLFFFFIEISNDS